MEETTDGRTTDHDLRAVIPRLVDLQRKCRSVGSRNTEALEMEIRLESIVKRLQGSEDGEAESEPPPYSALARELYAVERFFESNGFLSIAKEVAHVERTLEAHADEDEPAPVEPAPVPGDTDLLLDRSAATDDSGAAAAAEVSKWAVPRPLAAIVGVSVVAIAVCIVLVVRHERPVHPTVGELAARPTPAPTVVPPTPVPTPRRSANDPAPGAILAEEVGKARLALAEGDVDKAIEHLSQAALVDGNHSTVLATARQIVELLVDRSDIAADRGLWEVADLTLARAGRIAGRFGLDTQRIEEEAHRHARMDRFTLIQPTDTQAIRAAAGKRVTVFLKDGSKQESIVKNVQGGNLLLDEDTTVRGGAVYYVEKVPLADIDYLKVWQK
jgi:hypothetical protein